MIHSDILGNLSPEQTRALWISVERFAWTYADSEWRAAGETSIPRWLARGQAKVIDFAKEFGVAGQAASPFASDPLLYPVYLVDPQPDSQRSRRAEALWLARFARSLSRVGGDGLPLLSIVGAASLLLPCMAMRRGLPWHHILAASNFMPPNVPTDLLEFQSDVLNCLIYWLAIGYALDLPTQLANTIGIQTISRLLARLKEILNRTQSKLPVVRRYFSGVTPSPNWHDVVVVMAQRLTQVVHDAVYPGHEGLLQPVVYLIHLEPRRIQARWDVVRAAIASVAIPDLDKLTSGLYKESTALWRQFAPNSGERAITVAPASTEAPADLRAPGARSATPPAEAVPLPEAPAGFGWYTQQQVADIVGVSTRTVYNWINGRTGGLVIREERGNQFLLSHAELENKKKAEAARKARTKKRN